MANALALLGLDGEIFLPSSVSPAKLQALQLRQARLRLIDEDPGLVETIARQAAESSGRVYVSPYNDPQIIGGQGTIAVELLRQLPAPDAVLVPVGGGGLISGIASYLKQRHPSVRIVGCQPAASRIMAESIRSGRLLELPSDPSLSDATLGLVEPARSPFRCVKCWWTSGSWWTRQRSGPLSDCFWSSTSCWWKGPARLRLPPCGPTRSAGAASG